MKIILTQTLVAYSCAGLIAVAQVTPVFAQGVIAYPAAGQSAEQARKDEIECQVWATDRTGFSPQHTPPPSNYGGSHHYSDNSGPLGLGRGEVGEGGVMGDGARGAATGALLGAIAGDAGKGAAFGALGGALFGGARRHQRHNQEAEWQRQQQAQQQQQMQQYQYAQQQFNGAYGLCMESRNYKVQY